VTNQILMPKIGFSMNEGTLSEWLVADGDTVTVGQPIYALESDKSVQEIESDTAGTIKLIAQVGEVYQVGEVLAEIA
jgi:pyruvate/2-oxoglutarate dehydrogenase complex dihydrolipoamide acyltransferase (E2) component